MPSFSRQNILIGVAIVLALGGAYVYFAPGGQAPLTTTAAPAPSEQKFLTLAAEISSITFDTSIFSDKNFLSLVDLTTSIIPEAQGRIDPFAAIGR